MNSGWQEVYGGGTGTVTSMYSGGQSLYNGATGEVETMLGGEQNAWGTGIVETMRGGVQKVYGTGTVTGMYGGVQKVFAGGTGTVTEMYGGEQHLYTNGTGHIDSMGGGTLVMEGGTYAGDFKGYGTVSGNLALSSTQSIIASGGNLVAKENLSAGTVGVLSAGSISATGNISAGTLVLSSLPAGSPAISAGGSISVGNVDISNLDTGTGTGTRTMASAGSIANTNIIYGGGSAALTAGNSVDVKVELTESPNEYLTAAYKKGGRVSLSSDSKHLDYTFSEKTPYTQVTISGTVPWNTSAPLVSSLSSSTFDTNTKINLGGLSFSFTNEAARNLSSGTSMNLIASGVSAGTIETPAPETLRVSYEGTNTTLSATAAGVASIVSNALRYKVNGVTLNKVAVASAGTASDAVPTGWTAAA